MVSRRIYIGSDHAGFRLKCGLIGWLRARGYEAVDMGPRTYSPDDDYPDYAKKVCSKVLENGAIGILVCGSGQGMDRAANKIKGIHASVCWDAGSAMVAKKHGNINVLCLGERFVKPAMARRIVRIWLEEPFEAEKRHLRRIDKIRRIEGRAGAEITC